MPSFDMNLSVASSVTLSINPTAEGDSTRLRWDLKTHWALQ